MRDAWGRLVDYMRISVTDRCNLRCTYCMPNGIRWAPMEEILTYEEILFVCREAAELGICKFKITGGEPLVRKGCAGLIRELKKLPGVQEVTMTTNGILVGEQLPLLLQAGLDAVNISLDTLDEKKYEAITGSPELGRVRRSIQAALDCGIKVKINTVLQAGVNDGEWPEILELARIRKVDVRFIEMMPIGYGRQCGLVSNRQLLRQAARRYPGLTEDGVRHGNGPAVYYRIPGFAGSMGLISAIHGKFCGSCNRIRMTAAGELKPCLCYGESVPLREAARRGDREAVRRAVCRAVLEKPQMHCFERQGAVTERRKMAQIGG